MQFHVYEEETEKVNKIYKEMKVPTTTFGILRKQLVKNLGKERAQEVLFSFAYEIGVHNAKKVLEEGQYSLEQLVKEGPLMHIDNGHIEGIIHQCDFNLDENNRLISIVGQGTWLGSYEAQEHLHWNGPSETPVCSTLTGYASGYMSTVFNEELITQELSCVAKGDACCSWIIKTQKQWELETADQQYLQKPMTSEMELRYTYDQLLEQRNFIKKLSDFQRVLSDELLNENGLSHLCEVAYNLLMIPICIKDHKMTDTTYVGLSEKEYSFLDIEFNEHLQLNSFDNVFKKTNSFSNKMRTIETPRQVRFAMPVVIKNQLIAWCFFIYDKKRMSPKDMDSFYLERFVNTASITLLSERTKFESFERMKGNFLEQLLSKTISENEMLKRGMFAGVDLNHPYHIVANEIKITHSEDYQKFEIQERILEYSFEYFHNQQIHALIGHREGRIVFLIPNQDEMHTLENILNTFRIDLEKEHPNVKMNFGISNKTQSPLNADYAFKEATMALRLTFTKQIVFYEELGLISLLLKENDLEWVKHVAENELGALYNFSKQKNIELLKTLYIFLFHGGNLHKTKNELNLSLSGLRHRIQNIESLLDKDIRNPEQMYHLMLILKLLIISGELDLSIV